MIEVFKTNVQDFKQANFLIDQIQRLSLDYIVNFDLEDCDRILRVENQSGIVNSCEIINLFHNFNFYIEILQNEVPSSTNPESRIVN